MYAAKLSSAGRVRSRMAKCSWGCNTWTSASGTCAAGSIAISGHVSTANRPSLDTRTRSPAWRQSADGKRIVSGSYDKTVKVWDADKGQEIWTLTGHTGKVSSVAISADGKRIVSGSSDNTVKVWDADKGQEVLTLKGHTSDVTSVAISADGKRIVSGAARWVINRDVERISSGAEKLVLAVS